MLVNQHINDLSDKFKFSEQQMNQLWEAIQDPSEMQKNEKPLHGISYDVPLTEKDGFDEQIRKLDRIHLQF